MLLQAQLSCRLLQTCRPVTRYLAHTHTLRDLTTKRCFATAKKIAPKAQPSTLPKQPPPKAFQPSNSKATAPTPPTPSPKLFTGTPQTPFLAISEVGKGAYPENLLIYSAGTGRTIFLAVVRLTGIFITIFATCFIAPAYYYSEHEPTWMVPVVLGAGLIPIALMTLTTAPFVTYIHLCLPPFARTSHARLTRFATALPSTATLDLTTVVWVWPRVTRLQARELYIEKSQLGAMTLRREVPKAVWEARRWYDWRPLKRFYVAGGAGKVVEEGVWESVVQAVARGWGKGERLGAGEKKVVGGKR